MQGQRGLFTAHVDGKVHEFIFSTRDDVWRKRRHVMSPAFSAHKMKLVSENTACCSPTTLVQIVRTYIHVSICT